MARRKQPFGYDLELRAGLREGYGESLGRDQEEMVGIYLHHPLGNPRAPETGTTPT